ncbi:unnamed protein product [Rotaria sordida]|uniref:Peptidase C14 caspase domain-containing protein n=1 Tax=Rotaria sordida TaxID=392033 RepID=A0A819RLG4_9BILA|nr:unnamed protein product [Rotaria sordida]
MATGSKADTRSQPRRKLALVIGIDNYASGKILKNARNDACDMSSKLESIGFITTGPKLDLTYKQMELTLVEFKHSIEEGDIVLFYFAGHGTQWEDQNFLIPRDDADISVKGVKNRAILAQKLLDELTDRNPFVTIFLLDCCRLYYLRDRNLEQLRARGENLDTPKSSGLKEMHLSAGSLIAFACAPGAIANDLEGQRNGLFTKRKNKSASDKTKFAKLFSLSQKWIISAN